MATMTGTPAQQGQGPNYIIEANQDGGNDIQLSNFEPHPQGTFKAKLKEFRLTQHPQYGTNVRLEFVTEVVDDDGNNRTISAFTSYSLGKKGKIYAMLKAMGLDPDAIAKQHADALKTGNEDDKFRLASVVGKKLQVVVIHEMKDGVERDKIGNFLPISDKPVRKSNEFDDDPEPETAPPADSVARKAALLADD